MLRGAVYARQNTADYYVSFFVVALGLPLDAGTVLELRN